VKRLIGRPQEAMLCAKAKRQRQSTQLERRSTPRFEKGLNFLICHIDFIDIVVFQQHMYPFRILYRGTFSIEMYKLQIKGTLLRKSTYYKITFPDMPRHQPLLLWKVQQGLQHTLKSYMEDVVQENHLLFAFVALRSSPQPDQLRPSVIASGFFSSSLEKLLFKIRDIRQGLYLDSVGVCTSTE